MSALQVARLYFDAWNRRDAAAIAATFAPGGSYSDPLVPKGVSGDALVAYVTELWQAFPDLSFEIVSAAETENNWVAAQWLMRGTNTGSFKGLPPTRRAVTTPGADFIQIEGDKIRSVQGYFDSRAVPEQLGLQVIVQPTSIGPFSFGVSTSVQTGKRDKPGAFGITMLEARNEEEVVKIRELGRTIGAEMTKMSGFIGLMSMTVGRRMMTVSARDGAEHPRGLQTTATHVEAMRKFFSPELAAGGFTSVWVPARINPFWIRSTACSKMADSERAQGKCSCGASLPEQMPYW
jgi:steroid delta-isomerase-like uncharacterized protein